MKVLGLTGGIASGKSTVSNRLREKHNAIVIDADKIAWELAEPHKPLWEKYVERYGDKILLPDGTLDRPAIGKIVFADKDEKKWTDDMAHPLIKNEILSRIEQHEGAGADIAVLDVPLLYEVHWEPLCDTVWVVYVDEETQLRRLIERNGYTEQVARDRIASQMAMAEKRAKADAVIDNMGSIDDTMRQVDDAWKRLKENKS